VQEELESLGARFNLTREPFYIADHIVTTGEIPMSTDYESVDDSLFIREGDEFKPDPLADDLALIINAEFGLVVILGCAHRGIINTIYHAQSLTDKGLVYAIIGGTHLMGASEERIEKTAAELKGMGVQRLCVSHCTGFYASALLAREFGDAFFLNNTGSRFTLP
jgi:7,8-dihydropterin-6-yl-methyl-4-(beta-D-ribofuranosyl)aminobenzene 5'-phosphate synthase